MRSAHGTNVLERRQRRARWLLEAAGGAGAGAEAEAKGSGAAQEAEAAAAAAAVAADSSAPLTGKKADKANAKAEKKAKAEKAAKAAALADAARAALDAVKPNPKVEAMIATVESLVAPTSAEALGIPDDHDSTQTPTQLKRKAKRQSKNKEPLADAAHRAFLEMSRPVAFRMYH